MYETLVRTPVKVTMVGMEEDLLANAKNELGYEPTDSLLKSSTARASEVFTKLGIEQFSPGSVNKYKESMLQKKRTLWSRIHQFFNNDFGGISAIAGLVATLICLVISLMEYGSKDNVGFFQPWQRWILIPLAWGIAGVVCWAGDSLVYEWNRIPIAKYDDQIPAFALSRALEIKRECPEAEIYIETLEAENYTADPFLVVSIEGYLYYMDVWDEPTFEGARRK